MPVGRVLGESMDIYEFHDSDDIGKEEYDIQGENYKILIDLCCKYSSIVSFLIFDEKTDLVKQFDKYRISECEIPQCVHRSYRADVCDENLSHEVPVYYYRLCPELCELLANAVNGVFEWIYAWGFDNPEDITFYREDGSVFFISVVHDGYCALLPNENEDTGCVTNDSLWNWRDTEQEVEKGYIVSKGIKWPINPML